MDNLENIGDEFVDSIICGTGRAFVIMKENPDVDFSELIIKAAVFNFAYDAQCESGRADYVFRFIKKSKQKDKIIKAVLKKLITKKDDGYGLTQMFDLAILFYKSGYENAKTAMLKRLETDYLDGSDMSREEQVADFFGIEGLLKIAEIQGKRISENDEIIEDSYIVDDFQKKNRNLDVYQILENESKNNQYIKKYLDMILANKFQTYRRKKRKELTYEVVKSRIENEEFFTIYKQAFDLSEDEVKQLANDFLKEKRQDKQISYLRFFSRRQFPFDYQPIFKIASRRKEDRLTGNALDALSFFQGNDIRELCINKIQTLKNPCNYLKLLKNNYKEDDYKMLLEIINRSDNYEFIHSLNFGICEIYQSNSTAECKEPLELIYKKMNCGICRQDIVNTLLKNNVLSDNILKELQYDSDEYVRKIYRKK